MRPIVRILLVAILAGIALTLGVTVPSAIAAPPPCADLVITNFTVVPTDTPYVVAGRNARISITILNQGSCTSLSFTVQWLQDDGGLFTPPGGPATHQVGGLAAGASTTVVMEFAYPQAGDFTSVATLDTTNTVDETNESNNVDIEGVRVWANQPDLVVTGFSIVPATPAKGEEAAIQVTVKNQGTANAGPFVVQWTQDDTFAPTGPSKQVTSLAAGASTNVNFTYAFQEARDYNTVVRLDTANTVAEWNESNNMAIFPVTVIETAPDLVITNFTIKPVNPAQNFPQDQPVAGQNALIEITVLNQGADPAGAFVVQWKSDVFAPTGPSYQVSGLAPGASTVVQFVYAFPNPGNFQTEARIDTDNDVVEANENNNIQIKAVTVQPRVVDLVLTEFKVEPAPGVDASLPITPGAPLNPVRGRLTRVTITVENRGNVPSTSFRVTWDPGNFQASLSNQINSLNYDESTTITYDFTYPQAGFFFTTAKVDDLNQVFESNENNNNQTKLIFVEEQLPDLIIADIEMIPASPVAGTPAKARITVLNRGNTLAGTSVVHFVQAFLVPPLAQQIGELGVADMAARTAVIEFDTTYGFAGTFDSSATADATGVVTELDEFNNTRTESVVVQVPTQDLVITQVRVEEATCGVDLLTLAEVQALQSGEVSAAATVEPQLNENQTYQVCVTVQNLGNTAVGSFVVSLDPDAFDLFVPSLDTLTQQVDSLGAGQETVVAFNTVWPQDGNFTINALVDAFNTVVETNESNNLFIYDVIVVPTGPDLVISELVIGDQFDEDFIAGRQHPIECLPIDRIDAAGAGEHNIPPQVVLVEPRLDEDYPTRVCIKVSNIGTRPSGAFVVEWNADTFDLITTGPTTLSEQVANLDPGQSKIIVFDFVYVQVGTFHTVARADAHDTNPLDAIVGDVEELNEENNLAIADVVVDTTKPDLVIDQLTIAAAFVPGPSVAQTCQRGDVGVSAVEPVVIQGRAVEVCILVRNQGGQPSGPFVVAWNPDTFGLIVPSAGTISQQVDNLNPGETALVVLDFEYNAFNEFRTIAQVDFFNAVQESVEGNNEKILNVIVNPAPINLRIDSFTVSPNPVDRGSAIEATIKVCENANEYPTGAFTVEWQPTGDGIFNPTARVQGLLPGQCETVKLQSTILIADVYTSKALVDTGKEIIETNENDNTATTSIDVQPRRTTLQLDFTNIHINQAFEDGLDGNGEYEVALILVDPTATNDCDISLDTGGGLFGLPDIPIEGDGIRCRKATKDDSEDGDNFDPNVAFNITLEESFPMLFGAVAVEEDDLVDVSEFAGLVFQFWPSEDYLNVGDETVSAQFGDPPELGGSNSCGSDGACYTLTYQINVIDKPAPFFLSTVAAEVGAASTQAEQPGPLAAPTLVVPDRWADTMPEYMELPPGVVWPEGWQGWKTGTTGETDTNNLYLPQLGD